MAQFRGTVQGGRGEAARLGHKSTGLSTTCRGWNVGIDCHASTTEIAGRDQDTVSVSVNEGNGYNAGRSLYLGVAQNTSDGPIFVPSDALRALCRRYDAVMNGDGSISDAEFRALVLIDQREAVA